MADVPLVMISSTTRDLPRHREQSMDACLRLDFLPKMMEHLPPSPDDAVRRSLGLVDEADVYVLILGLRYGEIPEGYDKSYTHLELDRAVERKIPIIRLLSDDDKHPFTKSDIDMGVAGERILQLREEARGHGVSYFSSPEDLRSQLIHGLSAIRPRLAQRPASPHYVHQPDAPPAPFVAHPYTLLETAGVVGRQQELEVLTDWVADPHSQVFASRVLVLVAIGGMGKSALTWKWFHEIVPQELPTMAGRVWWSFYETDATFENFVLRTLAYVTGQPTDELSKMRPYEREDELLDVLNRQPYLVVLDGLERLLLAYARPDAARLADDDLDEQTANVVAGVRGLPASAAASFTGQMRLRLTADPRAGAFLKRLAGVQAARVLVTSRLYPAELQTVTMEHVPGTFPYFLRGLSPNDAVQLWRRWGGSGSRAELVELFAAFDNYPLLIRALAGEVARFRRAPGDLAAWRRANPGFDPFRLPLVQRKSHVLEYALSGLTAGDMRILHTVAAFRAPTNYDTLAALLVGPGRPCATEAELDRALAGLEDRGLLGWDRRGNRYDLHPVVRGVVWSGLDPDARRGIDLRLAAHFESVPAVDKDSVTSIDDLAVPLELFHILVRLGRYQTAFDLMLDRIVDPLTALGAFRQLGELAASVVSDPGWSESVEDDEVDRVKIGGFVSFFTALGYYFAGDPGRAAQAYAGAVSAVASFVERDELQGALSFAQSLRASALCQLGRLAEAEREAWQGVAGSIVAGSIDDDEVAGFAISALGWVLVRRGLVEAGRAWLTDYRASFKSYIPASIGLGGLGWLALNERDHPAVEEFIGLLEEVAAEEQRYVPVRVGATILRGALAARRGDEDQAGELLSEALATTRSAGLAEDEMTTRIELAGWHLRGRRVPQAREHLRDAIELAERSQLRLRLADALNVLSQVEQAAGDTAAAIDAARAAFRQAWCDGPPYSYAAALADARANLAAWGGPEPTGLPGYQPEVPLAPVAVRPTPPVSKSAAARRAYGWPTGRFRQSDVLAEIQRVGWISADNALVAELAARVADRMARTFERAYSRPRPSNPPRGWSWRSGSSVAAIPRPNPFCASCSVVPTPPCGSEPLRRCPAPWIEPTDGS